MSDKLKDECGVFGVFGHPEAANLTYLGLYALQHRGQEGAGIVSSDGSILRSHRQMGLVADIFNEDILKKLIGDSAIGHVRYSTAGASLLKNVQPFVVGYSKGGIAVAHNGNLVNAKQLRDELEERGSIFQSTMDTEVIVHLIASSQEIYLVDRIMDALLSIKGAYSLLFLTENEMIAVRDPNGFRPLVVGKLKDAYVISSETCALDLIDAEYLREVEPGEIVHIDENGLTSYKPFSSLNTFCIFELVYFARPDSTIFERNVYSVRKEMGRQLAIESPVEADIVMPVPDSGIPAAIGYAEASGIPFELGLIRNHYVGRTFIEPRESIRHFGVKIKLNSLKDFFFGKRVVVIDDSIVRGTTSRKIIEMIRNAGAREVHVRISSPPTAYPCFYGIDTPTRAELIASSNTVSEINRFITSDTLGYLTIEGLRKSVENDGGDFCDACFTGVYPVEPPVDLDSRQLTMFERVRAVG
ncbi:MAG: amidophosphoribosyltransferase [Thermodesulfobacteriota bacterium]|nr:amidophosphoribosyltransferase [Thermodesulfobacteriota bacterium]